MGRHAGQPHGGLLGQVGAAVAVMRAGGVGVGAAGPGVATVDTVQAAVRDKQRGQAWRGEGRGKKKEGNGRCEKKHKKTPVPCPEEAYKPRTCLLSKTKSG